MNSKLWGALMVSVWTLSVGVAMAHGSVKPKHGGVVAMASDLGFELVRTPTGAAIYVVNHGKPYPPAGMRGKLIVLNGADKSEAGLSVTADRLEATGIQLTPGATVVAALTTSAEKALTVRFRVP